MLQKEISIVLYFPFGNVAPHAYIYTVYISIIVRAVVFLKKEVPSYGMPWTLNNQYLLTIHISSSKIYQMFKNYFGLCQNLREALVNAVLTIMRYKMKTVKGYTG